MKLFGIRNCDTVKKARKWLEQVRDNIDPRSAHDLMLENPSLIKRPVVQSDGDVTVGFSADQWAKRFTP